MVGRQVIVTSKTFAKDELFEYLDSKWDKEEFPAPIMGKPTAASIDEYICLPASTRFMVIIYPKKPGLFSKKSKVVLCVCDSPEGIKDRIISSIPSKNVFFGAYKIGTVMGQEDERKGPAEDSLLKYTEYVKSILEADGYLA